MSKMIDELNNYGARFIPKAGFIEMFAGSTAPLGWLFCDGSEVLKADYQELYSAIGDAFGTPTDNNYFLLPDMRGRVPVGAGTGTAADATAHALGGKDGRETVTLTVDQIPSHVGHLGNNSGISYNGTPGAYMATNNNIYYYGSAGRGWSVTGNEASPAGVSRGGGQSHTNMQPYLGINFIIATGKFGGGVIISFLPSLLRRWRHEKDKRNYQLAWSKQREDNLSNNYQAKYGNSGIRREYIRSLWEVKSYSFQDNKSSVQLKRGSSNGNNTKRTCSKLFSMDRLFKSWFCSEWSFICCNIVKRKHISKCVAYKCKFTVNVYSFLDHGLSASLARGWAA